MPSRPFIVSSQMQEFLWPWSQDCCRFMMQIFNISIKCSQTTQSVSSLNYVWVELNSDRIPLFLSLQVSFILAFLYWNKPLLVIKQADKPDLFFEWWNLLLCMPFVRLWLYIFHSKTFMSGPNVLNLWQNMPTI